MDLERERGITIKAHPVTMRYRARDGRVYRLNLLDTPGHVDFSYEVSRSLAACEGALLVIDAAQGVEAQTVANVHLATRQRLTLVPVINKIDLPSADPARVRHQLEDVLAIPGEEALETSAKSGLGIEAILEAVIARIPPPASPADDRVRALVFDSVFDLYRGVIVHVRLFSGQIAAGDRVRLMSTGADYEVKEVGIFTPKPAPQERLDAGDVGYVIANIKESAEVKVGDTLTGARDPAPEPLPGFQDVHPMVFSGIYPIENADFEHLKAALGKLQLNDSALLYQPESSAALGFGFRCGFLGLLHMEIIQERLRREFNMDIIATYPSVVYHVHLTNGERLEIDNPIHLPDPSAIDEIHEPMVRATLLCPNANIGDLIGLVRDRRGESNTPSRSTTAASSWKRPCRSTRSWSISTTRLRVSPAATAPWTTNTPGTDRQTWSRSISSSTANRSTRSPASFITRKPLHADAFSPPNCATSSPNNSFRSQSRRP